MKKVFYFIFILILTSGLCSCIKEQPEIKLVPEPAMMNIGSGFYRISGKSPIYVDYSDKELVHAANYLKSRIEASSTVRLEIQEIDHDPGKGIYLTTDGAGFTDNPEGYIMEVFGSGITINGNSSRAVFYGIQSLLQLLPPEINGRETLLSKSDLKVPKIIIEDVPRFPYRGMHLDVGRHLFPVDFIKKYIDLIAMHKMNVFHWHLTEDQGWRIEIKKYPKLTEIGAWRNTEDGGNYGGFYTQEQIKEIVEYAKSRYVNIMPEIELPGHSVAALAAYPELSCTGGPFEVRTAWGVSEDIYCAGKEKTFEFLEDVIDEVVDLFPFAYFHIGGDEAPKTRWEDCPDCQKRIRDEGLADEHELQSYFISRIEDYLATKNKRLVGWDEILEGGLAPNATVMSWRGVAGGIAAAKQKHDVIMTPNSHLYFDFYQGDPKQEPKAIGGFLPMEKVYSYEPVPAELDDEEKKHILGAQGNVWTEYIATTDYLEYMAVPRMCALAEVVWTPAEDRDYEKFIYRMGAHYQRLDAMNLNYRVPPPVCARNNFVFLREFELKFHPAMDEADIHYTTDCSDPDANSPVYTEPIAFDNDALVKAATILPSGQSSFPITIKLDKQAPQPGMELGTIVPGLSYSLFEGSYRSTAETEELKADSYGDTEKFSIPDPEKTGAYALNFRGYLRIEQAGVYRFYTRSDDGSVFKIEGEVVVDNDGWHGPKKESGAKALGEGWHPIELSFIQAGGGQYLEVSWSGPDFDEQEIPTDKLASIASPMKMIAK